MDNILYKAHDRIIENQRNSDSKAYIFIILISALISYGFAAEVLSDNERDNLGTYVLFGWLSIILLFLVFSLMPTYAISDRKIKKKDSKKKTNPLNIFFWSSIAYFPNKKCFIESYQTKYCNGEANLSVVEKDLLEQIYINSNILERKMKLHKKSFFMIEQLIIITFVSIGWNFLGSRNYLVSIILLVFAELLYVLFVRKKITNVIEGIKAKLSKNGK